MVTSKSKGLRSAQALNGKAHRRGERGQTLIIAILVLGVLLIIGFAFAGLVSRNISEASRSQTRTIASDLAQAGLNFSHYQLVSSQQGADWRPDLTPPVEDPPGSGLSRDPDAIYLRPGSGLTVAPDPNNPLFTLVDRGGPDFRGPYSREFTNRGRRLIRVRYEPNNISAFVTGQDSSLRSPGKAKGMVVIESIGRSGNLQQGGRLDPTLLLPEAVQIGNYGSAAQLQRTLSEARGKDASLSPDTRKMTAFASLGLIESALFITNKYNSSRPAEIGFPGAGLGTGPDAAGSGAVMNGSLGSVDVVVPSVLGATYPEPNPGLSGAFQTIPGGGGIYSNANLIFHGQTRMTLNAFLGEGVKVSGWIRGANSASQLQISRVTYDRATDRWVSGIQGTLPGGAPYSIASTVNTPVTLDFNAMDSDSTSFSTVQSVIRDGKDFSDNEGFIRGIPRKEPPSMLAVDPQTRRNRYYEMTRNSGRLVNDRRIGRWGYGEGVYVDSPERANLDSEDERRVQGAVRSLPSDWLNPNNASSLGWQGPYYIPVAAYLQLLPDGFEIIRDSRSSQRTWRNVNGGQTGTNRVRFRIREIAGQKYIINSMVSPAEIGQPAGSLADSVFTSQGEAFNGVVFFEGDLRTRGVIPTDVQLTVVSMGTIYVEGSITKGLISEAGGVINRPSRSMLMLMARDYVTVNTSMFFGPVVGESPRPKSGAPIAEVPSPVELDPSSSNSITLASEFLTGPDVPGATVGSPSTWRPYAGIYTQGGSADYPQFLVSASADDNGPSFVTTDSAPLSHGDPASAIFRSLPVPSELDFNTAGTLVFNGAAGFYPPGLLPVYGLGTPTLNAYPKFETVGFPLFQGVPVETSRQMNSGTTVVALNDPTAFRMSLTPMGTAPVKNFLMAKAAVVPHDIRIEAAMFAEEGSFFVIPGSWFNSNPEDTRGRFVADETSLGLDQASLRRFQLYGNGPSVPFYGEPLDVRVRIIGALSQNMPAPMSQQAQWKQKWGWMPSLFGATGRAIPAVHIPPGFAGSPYVPNFLLSYDPALGFASADGSTPMRSHADGWTLPPLPRLPVSPTLEYFGDSRP